jgi:hypothetical protein
MRSCPRVAAQGTPNESKGLPRAPAPYETGQKIASRNPKSGYRGRAASARSPPFAPRQPPARRFAQLSATTSKEAIGVVGVDGNPKHSPRTLICYRICYSAAVASGVGIVFGAPRAYSRTAAETVSAVSNATSTII